MATDGGASNIPRELRRLLFFATAVGCDDGPVLAAQLCAAQSNWVSRWRRWDDGTNQPRRDDAQRPATDLEVSLRPGVR